MDSATKETYEVLKFRVIHITNGSTINAFVGYCTIQRRDRQTDRQTAPRCSPTSLLVELDVSLTLSSHRPTRRDATRPLRQCLTQSFRLHV